MSTAFTDGLDAVIGYLHQLKSDGVTHIEASREELLALARPVAPGSPPPQPTPRHAPDTPTLPGQIAPRKSISQKPAPAPDPAPTTTPVPAISFGPPLSAEDKESEFKKLQERVIACQICPHLARTRTQVVFGTGTIHADLMFVGEAPGAEEDVQGEPFVGRAGQLLTKMIQAMRLDRNDIYIGNILKCRPDMPSGSTGNRPPTPDEINNCRPYIISQIDIIRPKVLVALGSSAVRGLLSLDTGIGKLRGKWLDFRGIPVMPTYHPSYLLRKAGPSGLTEKRKAWEDLIAVMMKLGMPVSEKQQNYFLNAIQS